MSCGTVVTGSVRPRLATSPLRDLSDLDASYGHLVIEFAELIGRPLDPWQCEAVIRGGELLPDGSPRFRKVLLLVARQNGKTTLLSVLALYWLAVEQVRTVLGTSTKVNTAQESWENTVLLAQGSDVLSPMIPVRGGVRRANGEQMPRLGGGRYKIAAANGDAGRGLTLERVILDELREHTSYAAWDAVVPAMSAVPGAQVWCLSNAGHDYSVVLNDLYSRALVERESGSDLCLLDWSAESGADPLDEVALAAANPSLGYRMPILPLLEDARRAVREGGAVLAGFRTEHMCQRVRLLDPAIDPDRWGECGPMRGRPARSLDVFRARVALAWDVSPDGLHASVYAAAVDDEGHVHVDAVDAWHGLHATRDLRGELPGIVAKIRPAVVGWLPAGPAAAVAATLAQRSVRSAWPPAGVGVEAVKAEVPSVCMGFAELVRSGDLRHGDDPLLSAQVAVAQKQRRGDAWVFARPVDGAAYVDAVYAAASAAHLARTLKVPLKVTEVITVS